MSTENLDSRCRSAVTTTSTKHAHIHTSSTSVVKARLGPNGGASSPMSKPVP